MDVNVTSLQERAKVEATSYLEQLLSEGARKLLQAAIENEVAEYRQSQSGRRSESGERSQDSPATSSASHHSSVCEKLYVKPRG